MSHQEQGHFEIEQSSSTSTSSATTTPQCHDNLPEESKDISGESEECGVFVDIPEHGRGRVEWREGRAGQYFTRRASSPVSVSYSVTHNNERSRRDTIIDYCQCFMCYVVGLCVIAFCIFFMYRVLRTISWSNMTTK